MNDLDVLIKEKVIPLKKKAVDAMVEKHPHIFSTINKYLSKNDNRAGLQITENGKVIGEYTFILDGLYIKDVQSGVLSSEIHHPFGTVKPYGIIEKRALERMLQDEQGFINEPFSTFRKYMPDITIKFMK